MLVQIMAMVTMLMWMTLDLIGVEEYRRCRLLIKYPLMPFLFYLPRLYKLEGKSFHFAASLEAKSGPYYKDEMAIYGGCFFS